MFFSTIEFDELKEYKDKVMYVSGFSVVVVLAVFFAYAYHSPASVNWVWASGLFAYPVLLGILNDKLIETKPSVVCGLYLGSLLAYTIIILLALLHWFNGGEIGGEYEPFLIILGIGAVALDFRMRKTFKISE